MKITPVENSLFVRGSRSWAAALIAAGLTVSVGWAQSPGSTDGAISAQSAAGSSGSANGSGSGTSSSAGSQSYGATAGSTSSTNSGSTSSLKRSDRRFISRAADANQNELAASQLAAQRATNPQIRSFAQQIASDHQRVEQELTQLAQRKGVSLDQLTDSSSASSGRVSDQSIAGSTNAGIATDHGAPRATGAANTANTPAAAGIATNDATATSGSDAVSSSSGAGASDMGGDRHLRRLARKTGQDFDHEYVDLMVDSHENTVKLFQRAAKEAQDSEVRSFASSHLASLQAHLEQANSLMKSAAE